MAHMHDDGAGFVVDRSMAPAPALESRSVEDVIAGQVRLLRKSQHLSMAEVAERAGISGAMLSKVESAQTSCSLATLSKLARALSVPITALFRGETVPNEAVYTPAGSGSVVTGEAKRIGATYTMLGSVWGQHKRLEPLLVTLDQPDRTFPLYRHPGVELMYMLEGTLLHVHNETEYTLRPGDSLLFDAEGSHGPAELVRAPVRFLMVVTYPDADA